MAQDSACPIHGTGCTPGYAYHPDDDDEISKAFFRGVAHGERRAAETPERPTPLTDAILRRIVGGLPSFVLELRDHAFSLEHRLADQTGRAEKAERELQEFQRTEPLKCNEHRTLSNIIHEVHKVLGHDENETFGKIIEPVAALRAENTALKVQVSDNDDFMAFMEGELSDFSCCHETRAHSNTPPMMWPELIACIAKKARLNAETERDAALTQATQSTALVEAMRGALGEFRDSVLCQRHQLEEPCLDNDQTNAVLGLFDMLIGDIRAESQPSADLADRDEKRIYTRCPACGNDTLTINNGHLLCTWATCPDHTTIDNHSRDEKHRAEVAALTKERDAEHAIGAGLIDELQSLRAVEQCRTCEREWSPSIIEGGQCVFCQLTTALRELYEAREDTNRLSGLLEQIDKENSKPENLFSREIADLARAATKGAE